MKIAIIGAGAMGCLYGGYLSQHNDVILIDSNPAQVDAINTHGITVEQTNGERTHYKKVRACLSSQCQDAVDLVIVFVKSYYTQAALESNTALFKSSPYVMTLQNGAGNDKKISQFVPKEKVIIGTTTNNVVTLAGSHISHSNNGSTTIGSNYGETEILSKISATLNESGFEVIISDDIQRIIWSKIFINLSINCFTALLQTPIGYMVQNKYAWNFAKRLVYEAVEVAEADGTYFDRREVLNSVKDVCIQASKGYSSMYQDRKRHVLMEIDAINGAIVEQAKQYGVPTPYNAIIVDLIHAVEGTYNLGDEELPIIV